jgi:HEPN domain-containing protein
MIDRELLEEWFYVAADDLAVAKMCIEVMYPKRLAIACYHSQQSAEKSLKGFLFHCDIEPPKTHNLVALCELCIGQDATFYEVMRMCTDVNPYSTITRYPKEPLITEVMAQTAMEQAQTIMAFCRAKVPELVADKQ